MSYATPQFGYRKPSLKSMTPRSHLPSGTPRFIKLTLRRPQIQGGLVCPDFKAQFLAALLTHAHNWIISGNFNCSVVLEVAYLGSYESFRNLLYRGTRVSLPLTYSIRAVVRAWQLAICKHIAFYRLLPDTPLWLNPLFPEILSIPDSRVQASKGIKTLDHIFDGGTLRSFDDLKHRFGLPNSHFFRYLQLRHAFSSKLRSTRLTLERSVLEFLLREDPLFRSLSQIYKALMPLICIGLQGLSGGQTFQI